MTYDRRFEPASSAVGAARLIRELQDGDGPGAGPRHRISSYFPDWLLTHRRRAEQALVTVVATAYLLGVSTRRVERLAEQLAAKSLSRSQSVRWRPTWVPR